MDELRTRQERPPARRRGRRDVPRREHAPLDAVPWEGIGPGDALEGDVPPGERDGRHWHGEPWAQIRPDAERNGTTGSWSGNHHGRDSGQHRSEEKPE